MAKYIVSYDLNKQGQAYVAVQAKIQEFECVKLTTTTWLVNTTYSAAQLRDYVQKSMDGNDELFVAALTGEAAWTTRGSATDSLILNRLKAA